MTESAYADWLQRGRTHQREGRPVDAMLCFQRAAAIAPDGVDARYLLGEVQWQVGAFAASVAAWVALWPFAAPAQTARYQTLTSLESESVISGGRLFFCNTRMGWGSKVMAMAVPPIALAFSITS